MTAIAQDPAVVARAVDLRRAPLAGIRAIDFRAPERDLRADEAAVWDRLIASWAGLDEAAWHLPGAAKSDAGGPDWSLAEHVGHLAGWQELAIDYVAEAIETGRWPTDDDFVGGDFDTFNERRRAPWTTMLSRDIVARLVTARPRLLAAVRRLDDATIRGDDAWGWIYLTLHGHYLDHLGVIEPWVARLRPRQVDGDPFVEDPRAADHADFLRQDLEIQAQFDELIRAVPFERWIGEELTPGWTLCDHVGHMADWFAEASRAIGWYRDRGEWLNDPDEGIDAWNERHVEASRAAGETPSRALARYDAARAELLAAVDTMSIGELRSPWGWSWPYDCLHGHVRKHLAMLGPWSASRDWPAAS